MHGTFLDDLQLNMEATSCAKLNYLLDTANQIVCD